MRKTKDPSVGYSTWLFALRQAEETEDATSIGEVREGYGTVCDTHSESSTSADTKYFSSYGRSALQHISWSISRQYIISTVIPYGNHFERDKIM
jgi:hypothetical protein